MGLGRSRALWRPLSTECAGPAQWTRPGLFVLNSCCTCVYQTRDRANMRATQLLWATAAILLCTAPAGAAEKKTLGFAVTKWNTAIYESRFMDECPEGLNPSNKDIWWSTINAEQR